MSKTPVASISLDIAFLCFQTALDYSQYSHISTPNPHVGCVLWHRKQQQIVGIGRTQNYGEAHAELSAIEDAQKANINLADCVLFVTLEPCAHQGKTPPCVDKIIQAGIQEVCVLLKDPHPKVNGRGIAILQNHQINAYYLEDSNHISHLSHLLVDDLSTQKIKKLKKQAQQQMAGFLKFQNTQKPWVRLKFAISLDGFMALENGTSKWLTGTLARAHNQILRAKADVVLSTLKTVVADNARLNVRFEELLRFFEFQQQSAVPLNNQYINANIASKISNPDNFIALSKKAQNPQRWVLDAKGELLNPNFCLSSKSFQDLAIYQNLQTSMHHQYFNDVFIMHYWQNQNSDMSLKKTNLQQHLSSPTSSNININQNINTEINHTDQLKKLKINFNDVLNIASAEQMQEIHIEAGAAFTQYILEHDLCDELVVYQAPILLGSGIRPWPQHQKYQNQNTLHQAHQKAWVLHKTLELGDDICLIYTKN